MQTAQFDQKVHLVAQPAQGDPCADHYAALFALANGLIGIKGSIDECAAGPDTILPDAYVTRPISYHEAFPGYADATETRILCPSPVLTRVEIDGVPVDFASAKIEHFSRWLDLETGQLHRTTRWSLADGRAFEIIALRVVPLGGGALIASRFRFMAVNFTGHVTLLPRYGVGGSEAVGASDDPRISARVQGGWVAIASDASDHQRFQSENIVLDYRSCVAPTVGKWHNDEAGGGLSGKLGPSDSLAFDRVVEIGAPSCTPLPSFNEIARAQRDVVSAFWAGAQCMVEGDDRLTQALRFNLFQLFQSTTRDPAHGTAAKGLTGDGYEGHYFWDAEAFMVPSLVFTAPSVARTMIDYRIGKLDAARRNARQLGHKSGALYPWRTISGGECSSHYPTGAAQYHINGDVAYAVKIYVEATGDESCCLDAAEMLFETARIWMDIGQFEARRGGAFCIYGVTGPDEYTALVDNDFYTNAVARLHLGYAAETAKWLAQSHPACHARLADRLKLSGDEVALWAAAAAQMWLPVDGAHHINPQDDSFLSKPSFGKRRLRVAGRPLLLDHHPMTLFRHQVCKQGNVIQATAMGLVDQPLALMACNYAYYEPITSHDSTLSAPGFGVAAAQIGAFADARRFLDEAAFVDLDNLHSNTDHGLHMAALAGSWLILAQGWAGLSVRDGALHFRPQSAPEMQAYRLTLAWQGSTLSVAVNGEGATYAVVQGAEVVLYDYCRRVEVGSAPVYMPRPSVRAVIFDLDGVLTDTAEDHYHAWAELARRHGLTFDRAFNEKLKGVDRTNSLRLILAHSGATLSNEAFEACLAEKNGLYQARLDAYAPEHLFDGVRALFAACRAAGLKVALASASRNASTVIARLGIADQFDFIADAGTIAHPKPAPDIFLACAAALGVPPVACVGVEDAQAGVDAICAAGMPAIGIGEDGALNGAQLTVAHIADLTITQILGCVISSAPQDKRLVHQLSAEDVL